MDQIHLHINIDVTLTTVPVLYFFGTTKDKLKTPELFPLDMSKDSHSFTCLPLLDMNPVAAISLMFASTYGTPVRPSTIVNTCTAVNIALILSFVKELLAHVIC